jgi:hypothetical protein
MWGYIGSKAEAFSRTMKRKEGKGKRMREERGESE